MANYAVSDWVSDIGTLEEVAAAIETKLETLDDTANPIQLLEVKRIGTAQFQAILIHDA